MTSILYQAAPRPASKSRAPLQAEQARTVRLNAMGQFAASIAHEVNQPLAAIALNASAALRWLEQDPPRLEHVRDALATIASASSHASAMILSLRCLACKNTATHATFPADDPARQVLLLLHTELQQQGIAIETQLTLGQQAVLADRVQLQQVLMNLVSNAADAMRANGDAPRTLLLASRRDGAMLHFSVTDSGAGVAPESAARIYEPLYSTRAAGMGLGLAICRAIVEAHGGQLWHEAAKARGAIFHFTVPSP